MEEMQLTDLTIRKTKRQLDVYKNVLDLLLTIGSQLTRNE